MDQQKLYNPRTISFEDFQQFMAEFLSSSSCASRAWDVITCQRGPDFPSERPNQTPQENEAAYVARRQRKYDTVEVIRRASFNGVVGSAARSHAGDTVKLPPTKERDHFDRHVEKAARALGLKVVKK